MRLSHEDKEAMLDLRPFMDPSPYVVNELMPLRRVYRLFNEIGVRHLTVVDCREQVSCGRTSNPTAPCGRPPTPPIFAPRPVAPAPTRTR